MATTLPLVDLEIPPMPRVRGECLPGGVNAARPCVHVRCRHHLAIEVDTRTGRVVERFPGLDLEEMPASCSLDVSDEGEHTLNEVRVFIGGGLTRERIRQVESEALRRLARAIAKGAMR